MSAAGAGERGQARPAAGERTRSRWILGVDIGGTNLRAGLVPFAGGAPVALANVPTRPEHGAEEVVDDLVSVLRATVAGVGRAGVAGIGVGAPGPLDRTRGVVIETPNLGWREVPLVEMIARGTGLPVVLDNDANCFAFGEWWLGAGRGAERLIGLTLGTGIGGGIVLGGEIYRGASDAAGEVGHMSVHHAGRLCACGSRGCVEAYASGTAIAARAAEGIGGGTDSSLSALVRDPAGITSRAVCEAAAAGDPHAARVLDEAARMLGVAVANLIHIFNPDVIVVGGGVAAAGELVLAPLRAEAERRAFRSAAGACRIVPAEHPATAGLLGAAGVFKRALGGSAAL